MENRDMRLVSLLVLIIVIALAGCTTITPAAPTQFNQDSTPEETTGVSPTQPVNIPAKETPDRIEKRPVSTLPEGLERVEIPQAEPVTGEVPAEILDEIFLDLFERTGAGREEIQVVRAEAVVWNDGSLGCPKPGEVYIQILVNGYWVVLEVEGTAYDYRVSDTGYFTLCEGRGFSPISTPPDPGTGPSPDQ